MKINYSEVHKINNSHLIPYITRKDHKIIINGDAGQQHYKLLTYMSMQKNNVLICELGTHHGTSSTALSVNKTNKIVTWDIRDQYGISPQPQNIERKIGNIFDLNRENELLEAEWIFIDTDHLGVFEYKVYNYLEYNKYKGMLLIDDIAFNEEMKVFWNNITHKKYDLTEIGHAYIEKLTGYCGGTGLVDFGENVEIIK